MTETLRIRRAASEDMKTIIDLIDDARAWLPGKGTDQWAKPWPNPAARDARVLRDLKAGRTWLVHENGDEAPVATVTCSDTGNRRLWTPDEQLVSAAYIARLIVRRNRAGERIGEALVDWAGARGVPPTAGISFPFRVNRVKGAALSLAVNGHRRHSLDPVPRTWSAACVAGIRGG
jgi:hypothetical protein